MRPGRLLVGTEPGRGAYRVRVTCPMRIAGHRVGVGSLVELGADRLRVAAHLVRVGAGRPEDADTARDVELYERLRALPAATRDNA